MLYILANRLLATACPTLKIRSNITRPLGWSNPTARGVCFSKNNLQTSDTSSICFIDINHRAATFRSNDTIRYTYSSDANLVQNINWVQEMEQILSRRAALPQNPQTDHFGKESWWSRVKSRPVFPQFSSPAKSSRCTACASRLTPIKIELLMTIEAKKAPKLADSTWHGKPPWYGGGLYNLSYEK